MEVESRRLAQPAVSAVLITVYLVSYRFCKEKRRFHAKFHAKFLKITALMRFHPTLCRLVCLYVCVTVCWCVGMGVSVPVCSFHCVCVRVCVCVGMCRKGMQHLCISCKCCLLLFEPDSRCGYVCREGCLWQCVCMCCNVCVYVAMCVFVCENFSERPSRR